MNVFAAKVIELKSMTHTNQSQTEDKGLQGNRDFFFQLLCSVIRHTIVQYWK
jgi:hypothetical protein